MNRILNAIRRTALAIGLAMLWSPQAMALNETEASAFVTNVVDRVIELVESKPAVDVRHSEFRMILTETAAMPQIGRFAAGRSWRAMSEAQQGRYTDVFVDYIASIYARRFDEYSGETLTVNGAQDLGERGFVVKSEASRQGAQPIRIEWLVSDRSGSTRIDDIIIEGVSLAITQREEFAAMIAQQGDDIDAFIAELSARSEI